MDHHQPTILLADDNLENLNVLSRILENEGYKVRTAKNGQLALNSIQTAPPDMALIDLHMPVMDGYELCKQIKNDSRLAHIPVLFISAIGESFNKVIAFELGAVDYLSKPVDPREVIARVSTHLKILNLQRELENKNQDLEKIVKERTADLDTALLELKQLNERLSSLDQAKNNFLRLISHELRTPLVGLGIADELFNDKSLSEEDFRNFQNIFWASHQKLMNIVDHATVLTHLNLNKPSYCIQPNSIRELLELSYQTLKPLMDSLNVSIELVGNKEDQLYCDHEYSRMVFNALIETAIKFTSEGNKISINWASSEEASTVQINANGWILPDKFSTDFFEVMSIHETIFPGGDLGLAPAVAKQVMNVCGGSIRVRNREDKGIALTVTFPKPCDC